MARIFYARSAPSLIPGSALPLHLDLFQQPRFMVSGVEIGLKIWPRQNAFRQMSNALSPTQKVQILDARFKVCVQKLNPDLLVAHEDVFKNSTALYPYLRSEKRRRPSLQASSASVPTTCFKDWFLIAQS